MGVTKTNFIVMEMTEDEQGWVRRLLDAPETRFDELDSVDAWYIVDRNPTRECVEVIPVVGLEAEEPDRPGFIIPGTLERLAPILINMGFPIKIGGQWL